MRLFLTGLVAFCVLAGLNVRVLAAGHDRAAFCGESSGTCCVETLDSCPQDDRGHGDDDCPGEHHHHHACCSQLAPLTDENPFGRSAGFPGRSLTGIRHEGEIAPEGPFLGSEKPPLI